MNPSMKTGENQETSMDTVSQSKTGDTTPAKRGGNPPVEHRFQPGKSGNPNGRPKKVQDAKTKAEEHVDAAMSVLVKALKDEDPKIRIAAANAILDRGLGKPKQSVEMKADVTNHGSEPVSDTARWIEDTLRARADRKASESVPH